MGETLRSILTRLVAYVAVAIATGLLFLAGATVYELMWPRPSNERPPQRTSSGSTNPRADVARRAILPYSLSLTRP